MSGLSPLPDNPAAPSSLSSSNPSHGGYSHIIVILAVIENLEITNVILDISGDQGVRSDGKAEGIQLSVLPIRVSAFYQFLQIWGARGTPNIVEANLDRILVSAYLF